MKRNQFLCGLGVALLAAAASGCAKSDAESVREEARVAPTLNDPFTGKLLTVCNPRGGAHHKPEKGETFEIVETVANSGVYALKLTNPHKWAEGFTSLTLARTGTADAQIPHLLWTNKCKAGDNSKPLPFAPAPDTIRLWGQTCLPDGKMDPVKGLCDGKRDNFHEVVIYVHKPNSQQDVAHVMMQYCGRHELDPNTGKLSCEPVDDEDEDPHPGHIHIQP